MHSYIFETNFLVDFVLNKTMTEEENKLITREKHPGRVTQGHKLAALMEKIKEQILRNKEHSTVQSTEQSTEQSSVQSTEQPSVQSTVQSTVLANDTYVYGLGMLAVLAIGGCVFFAYNTFQPKKLLLDVKKNQSPERGHML